MDHHEHPGTTHSAAPADELTAEAALILRHAAQRARRHLHQAAHRLRDTAQLAAQPGAQGATPFPAGLATAHASVPYTVYKTAYEYTARLACAQMWTNVEHAAGWFTGNPDKALLNAAQAVLEAWLDTVQADAAVPQESPVRGFREAEMEGRKQFMRDVRETTARLENRRRTAAAWQACRDSPHT